MEGFHVISLASVHDSRQAIVMIRVLAPIGGLGQLPFQIQRYVRV